MGPTAVKTSQFCSLFCFSYYFLRSIGIYIASWCRQRSYLFSANRSIWRRTAQRHHVVYMYHPGLAAGRPVAPAVGSSSGKFGDCCRFVRSRSVFMGRMRRRLGAPRGFRRRYARMGICVVLQAYENRQKKNKRIGERLFPEISRRDVGFITGLPFVVANLRPCIFFSVFLNFFFFIIFLTISERK